jgi:hypothetical protein
MSLRKNLPQLSCPLHAYQTQTRRQRMWKPIQPPGKVIKPPTLYDRAGRPRIKGIKINNTIER